MARRVAAGGREPTGSRGHPITLLILATLLVVAAIPVAPALAQGSRDRLCGGSPYTLDRPLVVPRNSTLEVCAGTTVQGAGSIEVNGTLLVNGTAASPAILRLPVRVLDGGNAVLRWSEHPDVPAALEVRGGNLTLRNATLRGDVVGLLVDGPRQGRVTAWNLTVLHPGAEGVRVTGPAHVVLHHLHVEGAPRGVSVDAPGAMPWVELDDSTLAGDVVHVDVTVTGNPAPLVLVRGSNLTSPPGDPAEAALHVHGSATVTPSDHPALLLQGSRVSGARVGLLSQGDGYVLTSTRNRYAGNLVGVHVEGAQTSLFLDNITSVRWDLENLGPAAELKHPGTALDRVCTSEAACAAGPASSTVAAPTMLPSILGVAFLAVLVLVALAAGGGILRTRVVAPIAQRLGPPEARDPQAREVLRRYLVEHPGATRAEAAGDLALPHLAVVAHLARLEAANRAAPLREEGATRWYATAVEAPDGAEDPGAKRGEVTEAEARVLEALAARPGASQAGLAEDLGLTRQAVHYHVRKLEARGLVRKERDGRTTRLYAEHRP